jgi:ribosomal-protein-serine acetyltransferase
MIPNPRIIVVSPSLTLSALTPADAPVLFTLTDKNRERLNEYLPWVTHTTKVADSLAFIDTCQKNWETGEGAQFGIFLDGTLVGCIGVKDIQASHQGEIGYWIAEQAGGKGVMTQAAQALVHYSFHTLKLARLLIRARAGNLPSAAVAKRLGFVHEGTERFGELHDGKLYDMERYSKLSSDASV